MNICEDFLASLRDNNLAGWKAECEFGRFQGSVYVLTLLFPFQLLQHFQTLRVKSFMETFTTLVILKSA